MHHTVAAVCCTLLSLSSTYAFDGVNGIAPFSLQGWEKGTVVFALNGNEFNNTTAHITQTVDTILHAMPWTTFIAVQFMLQQESATSNVVNAPADVTPSLDDVRRLVRYIKSKGRKVMLKVLVVARGGVLMSDIRPSDPPKWFRSYSGHMATYFSLADQEGIDIVSVGLELQQMVANAGNDPLWAHLIQQGRVACPQCKLTYCSNPITNETQMVRFWDQLDFVGLDYYPPYVIPRDLNDTIVLPSRAAMVATYKFVLHKKVLAWYITEQKERRMNQNGGTLLPQMFVTESGYPSNNVGLQSPWLQPPNCSGLYAPNITAQATAYEVALEVLSQGDIAPLFAGFTQFWAAIDGCSDYYPNRHEPGSVWACGWNPIGKDATLNVFRKAFHRT